MVDRHCSDWLGSYLRYTDNTEPPSLFREWCGVSAIAAALERKCWLEWGSIEFFPNMYIVLVSPPGKARKGTAMKPMQDLVRRVGVKQSADSITREAIIQSFSDASDTINIPDGHVMRPYVHSSLTIVSPELTVFLGSNNIPMLSALTDWFDCAKSWEYRTKNSGTDSIKGLFLNLVGATTPDLIRTSLPSDAIGGGLTSRIIFVYEEKKGKTVPFPFATQEEKVLEDQLYYDLEKIKLLTGRFVATEHFLTAWAEWYMANDGVSPFPASESKIFGGYIERRPTQLLKLSMIHCASRGGSMCLEPQDLQRAISLLERTEVKMPKAFGGVGESKYAHLTNQIVSLIGTSGSISKTAIKQRLLYEGTPQDIVAILFGLVEAKILNQATQGADTMYSLSKELDKTYGGEDG